MTRKVAVVEVGTCWARSPVSVSADRGTSWGSTNRALSRYLFYRDIRHGGGQCFENTASYNNDARVIQPNGRCRRAGKPIDCPLAQWVGGDVVPTKDDGGTVELYSTESIYVGDDDVPRTYKPRPMSLRNKIELGIGGISLMTLIALIYWANYTASPR